MKKAILFVVALGCSDSGGTGRPIEVDGSTTIGRNVPDASPNLSEPDAKSDTPPERSADITFPSERPAPDALAIQDLKAEVPGYPYSLCKIRCNANTGYPTEYGPGYSTNPSLYYSGPNGRYLCTVCPGVAEICYMDSRSGCARPTPSTHGFLCIVKEPCPPGGSLAP